MIKLLMLTFTILPLSLLNINYISDIQMEWDIYWSWHHRPTSSPSCICADSNGDFFLSTEYLDELDPEPSMFERQRGSSTNFSIVKISRSGEIEALRHLDFVSSVNQIIIDRYDNLYACGEFYGEVDFGTGSDTCVIELYDRETGNTNSSYIAKYDNDLNLMKVVSMPGRNLIMGTNRDGCLLISGVVPSGTDVDPGEGIEIIESGNLNLRYYADFGQDLEYSDSWYMVGDSVFQIVRYSNEGNVVIASIGDLDFPESIEFPSELEFLYVDIYGPSGEIVANYHFEADFSEMDYFFVPRWLEFDSDSIYVVYGGDLKGNVINKISSAGHLKWSYRIPAQMFVNDISVSSTGNVIVTGSYVGELEVLDDGSIRPVQVIPSMKCMFTLTLNDLSELQNIFIENWSIGGSSSGLCVYASESNVLLYGDLGGVNAYLRYFSLTH